MKTLPRVTKLNGQPVGETVPATITAIEQRIEKARGMDHPNTAAAIEMMEAMIARIHQFTPEQWDERFPQTATLLEVLGELKAEVL